MTPATRAWLDGLAAHLAARGFPPPAGVATAAERMILAAHFAMWLDASPALDEARTAWARATPGADPDPAIVITTSPAGIAVVEEILAGDEPLAARLRPRAAVTTEKDYRAWCMRHPDDAHLLHVNHWSWIKTQVPSQRHAEFAPHRLREGEAFWLHRTGTAGAGSADGRSASLWKFTGHHAAILEPRLTERRVPPPGA